VHRPQADFVFLILGQALPLCCPPKKTQVQAVLGEKIKFPVGLTSLPFCLVLDPPMGHFCDRGEHFFPSREMLLGVGIDCAATKFFFLPPGRDKPFFIKSVALTEHFPSTVCPGGASLSLGRYKPGFVNFRGLH